MDRMQKAQQLRRAIQLFAASLAEEQMVEVVAVFDPWEVGKNYTVDTFVTYGTNGVGDPQLYKVVQAHTAQANWPPVTAPSLYTPIGLDSLGYPVWAQPAGAHDAYASGDIVNYGGSLYRSTVDGNVYSPEVYPAGWELYTP